MKKSRIVRSLLCLLLASTSVISAYKAPQAAPYANAEPSIEEPTCVSQEVVLVDGVDVALSLYVDQGVLVRTAAVVDESQKEDLNMEELESAILQQNAADYQYLQQTPYRALAASLYFLDSFSNYETNSVNQNCNVGHSGDWYRGMLGGEAFLEAKNLQVGTVYSGPGNAELIVLAQTISTGSTALSFSAPPGFSIGPDSRSATWTSAPYPDVSFAEAYISGSAISSGAMEAYTSIVSTSEIRANPYTSYVTSVSDNKTYHIFAVLS